MISILRATWYLYCTVPLYFQVDIVLPGHAFLSMKEGQKNKLLQIHTSPVLNVYYRPVPALTLRNHWYSTNSVNCIYLIVFSSETKYYSIETQSNHPPDKNTNPSDFQGTDKLDSIFSQSPDFSKEYEAEPSSLAITPCPAKMNQK